MYKTNESYKTCKPTSSPCRRQHFTFKTALSVLIYMLDQPEFRRVVLGGAFESG